MYNRYIGLFMSTDIREYELNTRRMKSEFEEIRNYTFSVTQVARTPCDRYNPDDQVEY